MNKNKELLPYYVALSELIYWKEGKPYNKINRNRYKKDALSGGIYKGYRYLYVSINGVAKSVKAHRLAWYMYYGALPKGNIDYIRYNEKDNNHISNLRECTDSQQAQNRRGHKNSSSQYKGVCWSKRYKKWRAQISIPTVSGTGRGKIRHIGRFDCEHTAAEAYNEAAIEVFRNYAVLNDIVHTEVN